MKEQRDTILDRNEIFHRIFEGRRIKPHQMFSTIRVYTPSGVPKGLAHTSENVSKYNDFVRKRQIKDRLF